MKTFNFKNMKAGTLLVLLLSFVLASCSRSQQPPPPVEVSILWSEIDQGVGLAVGDILEVVLPANPATNYAWEAGFYNKSVLKPYGEQEFSSTSTNLSAEETQKLRFEAIGEGETDLVLIYRRAFENVGMDQQTFQVHVFVE